MNENSQNILSPGENAAEQRSHARRKLANPVPIQLVPGKEVWLEDLGEGGLAIFGSSRLQLGSTTDLHFQFPDANSVIEASGVIAWSDVSGRTGIRFTNIKPDSNAALKRWIRAQTAAADAAARTDTGASLDYRVHCLGQVSELQSKIASQELTEGAALKLVLEQMLLLTRAAGAAIALKTGADVICRASMGAAPQPGARLNGAATLSSECLKTGNIVSVTDCERDARIDPALARQLNFRSLLILPVSFSGETIGLIEVFSPVPGNFEGGDVLVLGFLAELVASVEVTATLQSAAGAAGDVRTASTAAGKGAQ
jgi:hypothetical protein